MRPYKIIKIGNEEYPATEEQIEDIKKMLKEEELKQTPKHPICGHNDLDVCDCKCHDPNNKDIIRHMLVCCITCRSCGRKIKY